jgi:hypothetical protein
MIGYTSFTSERRDALDKVGKIIDNFRIKMFNLHEE